MASESVMKQCGTITGNCTYIVPADADPQRMIEDVGCWLDSAQAILNPIAHRLSEPGRDLPEQEAARQIFAALHLIGLADNVANAIESRLLSMR